MGRDWHKLRAICHRIFFSIYIYVYSTGSSSIRTAQSSRSNDFQSFEIREPIAHTHIGHVTRRAALGQRYVTDHEHYIAVEKNIHLRDVMFN